MRRVVRGGLLSQSVLALLLLVASSAAAAPASGPRQTVDQRFTTKRPGTPTGLHYSGSYHAAGDPEGNPPFLRRMTFHPPRGMRYDTSVPDRCTASDAELQLRGPEACPPRSRLGKGTTEGLFLHPLTGFHEYKHDMHVVNNTDEQLLVIDSPLRIFTVVRGEIRHDGSIEYNPPTCFPVPPTGCVNDYILQRSAATFVPPYTEKTPNGRIRSYARTPRTCPKRRYWKTTIRFWWSDGSEDAVTTRQPCRRLRKAGRRTPGSGRSVALTG